jgi:hypothetical protein
MTVSFQFTDPMLTRVFGGIDTIQAGIDTIREE